MASDAAKSGEDRPGDGKDPRPAGARAPAVFALIAAVILLGSAVSVSMFRSGSQADQLGQVLGEKQGPDGLLAEATITGVDPQKSEMSVRLALNPEGTFDQDGLLSRPVVLFYDTLNGTKQVDFKAKKPLGAVDLSLPLVGDSISSYPWDVYDAEIELLFLTVGDDDLPKDGKDPAPEAFDDLVPVSITVYKNIPAYNVVDVAGSTQDDAGNDGVVQAAFTVKRAATAQAFSLAVSVVMWCLALGVLFLAISVISGRRPLELTHISVMGVILFAMPAALRSFQPGVPPPGVLSDFYSFFWCDVVVAAALIATLFTYVKRRPT